MPHSAVSDLGLHCLQNAYKYCILGQRDLCKQCRPRSDTAECCYFVNLNEKNQMFLLGKEENKHSFAMSACHQIHFEAVFFFFFFFFFLYLYVYVFLFVFGCRGGGWEGGGALDIDLIASVPEFSQFGLHNTLMTLGRLR